jgi:hypothetical protein
MLIAVKGVVKEDILMLPRGAALAGFMERRGWI